MVAEAEVVVCQQSVDVKYFPNKGSNNHEIGDVDSNFDRVRVSESVSAELLTTKEVSFFRYPFQNFFCCWMM